MEALDSSSRPDLRVSGRPWGLSFCCLPAACLPWLCDCGLWTVVWLLVAVSDA